MKFYFHQMIKQNNDKILDAFKNEFLGNISSSNMCVFLKLSPKNTIFYKLL